MKDGMNLENKLVVLDIEGVLLPKKRVLILSLSEVLGLSWLIKASLIGLLYELGIISLKKAIQKSFEALRGVSFDVLLKHYDKLPKVENA